MQKKLLVLGGKPIGSLELVKQAQEMGIYVVVTDFLPPELSPAKMLANEAWDISTAEVEVLTKRCSEARIDGVLTAVHEFNINRMLDVCEFLHKPSYCTRNTWRYCDNKVDFKALCERHHIPIARKYELSSLCEQDLALLPYPLVTKPVDGSGSRGFSICNNADELRLGYKNALKFSPNGIVLIEDYIPYDSVIIHYTMIDRKCHYSGMSDKYSAKFASTGAPVMGLQTFPSSGEAEYLRQHDADVRGMFEQAGFTDGPIWIEAFFNGKSRFVFNEMGYRLGGSLTHYPVKYFYGIDQLELMIQTAMGIPSSPAVVKRLSRDFKYCILPIHIKPGVIVSIENADIITTRPDVYAYVPVHYLGDTIEEWGSAQQVFCYLHLLYQDTEGLKSSITSILGLLRANNENGANLLYTLFNLNKLSS